MSLEIKSLKEEKERCRSAYLYELTVRNSIGEEKYYIDMNHQASINQGKIEFERNKTIDYSKFAYECTVLDVTPFIKNGNNIDEIIKEFNQSYRNFEAKWKNQDLKNSEV